MHEFDRIVPAFLQTMSTLHPGGPLSIDHCRTAIHCFVVGWAESLKHNCETSKHQAPVDYQSAVRICNLVNDTRWIEIFEPHFIPGPEWIWE